MIDSKLGFIYNKKYLVIVPAMSKDLIDIISYSFGNTVFMNNDVDSINDMIKFINQSNFKKLIFIDYQAEFEQVINGLINEHEIKFLFTKALGALSDQFIYYTFNSIYKLYDSKVINEIGFIDRGLYSSLLKKGNKVSHVLLDIEKTDFNKDYEENTVGLLNDEGDAKHSFYNELSAIKLIDNYSAKILKPNKTTKDFISLLGINSNSVKSTDKLIKESEVNLYINFTGNDYYKFINSMDSGVPCIIGNNEILDNCEDLKKYLMIDSDDDIDEIAERIKMVSKNRDKVLKLYKKFRENYSNESKESIEKFLECKKDVKVETANNDILISIIVPVYNVEKYLSNSLDSILNSVVDKTEILLINDGSTDKSEEICLKYAKQYPNLIRYIKQENHGLGNVRNVGLKESKGKYIASIDSDDTVSPNFFTEALEALKNDVDVVIYDWVAVTNDGKFDTPAIDYIFVNESVYEGILYTTIMPSTCNKIFKKSLYEKLDIHYIEDKYEDLSANPFVLFEASTFKYIRKPYYEYYIRSDSIMRTSAGFSMIDIIKVVEERINKYREYINIDIDKFKFYTFSWRSEDFIMNQFYDMSDKEIDEFSEYIYNNIKDILVKMYNSDYYLSSLDGIKDEKNKNYIIDRNKAFEKGELAKFIKKAKKDNSYFKYIAGIVLYGE